MLPKTSFKDPMWDSIGKELWPIVAKMLGAKRVARQVSDVKLPNFHFIILFFCIDQSVI